VLRRHQALSLYASLFGQVVAVAGGAGKTSTSAVLAAILAATSWQPTVYLGARSPNLGGRNYRHGQRRLLMIGAGAFAIASAAAAYSTSAGMLIAARAVLGIAGATLMPSVLGLISAMFRQPGQRATAISCWAACLLAGTAIGPVVGGILLQLFWWGSVFLMGLPVMAVLMVTAPILLPEYRDPGRGRLDLISVALSLAAVLAIVYSLTTLARTGISIPAILSLMTGLAGGLVFVYRQNHITVPLLDLRLLRYRAFRTTLGILLLGGAISGGISFLFAQYLQSVEGLSALRAGLWSLPDTAGMIACALVCPLVARHLRPGYVIGAGLAVSAAGFLALTQVQAVSGLPVAVTGVVIVFIGVTPAWVLGTDLIVGSVPPEKGGPASSLSETSSELGVALGIAVIGSIGSAVYRLQAAHTLPAGVPPQAAAAARDSLAGAVSAAARLHEGTGRALRMAARQAFTHGLNTAALAGIVIAAALALLAAVMLRHTQITAEVAVPGKDSSSSAAASAMTGEQARLAPQPCR